MSASTVCRASVGSCDITERCSGTSGDCPQDEHILDGTPCTRGSVSAFCYSGECPSRDVECQRAWGKLSVCVRACVHVCVSGCLEFLTVPPV